MRRLILWCVLLAGAAEAAAQELPPTRILIAFYSETGNTEQLARAARDGAASVPGIEVSLRRVEEVGKEEILAAEGILVGTPVHWGSAAAAVKQFLDRVGNTLLDAGALPSDGRTGGAFCTGGAESSGKELARWSILSAFLNMRFVVLGGVDEEGFGTLGPQATTGPSDPGVGPAELDAARRSSERFARLTRALHRSLARSAAPERQ